MKYFNEWVQINEVANTIAADINEIYFGYFLNGGKWFDNAAKAQAEKRIKEIGGETAAVIPIGQAEVMAKIFLEWAKKNSYSGVIKKIFWTARSGSLTAAVGQQVDQAKNPTDILAQFTSGPANGFLGGSLKSTKAKSGTIAYKNPGIGTVDSSLKLNLGEFAKQETEKAILQYNLPKSATERKSYIRANPKIKIKTEEAGSKLLSTLRDMLLKRLHMMKGNELYDYLLTYWMDADILYPPYIKVQGNGNKPPFTASVFDPLNNPKMKDLQTRKFKLEATGNESISINANNHHIMKIRLKYESEKLSSSLKLSGE